MDLKQIATEAEADRLSGVYLRIRLLAQNRRLDVLTAGDQAVREGLEAAADWEVVREAVTGH